MELANNLDNNLLTSSNVTLEEQKGFLDCYCLILF